MWLAVLRINGGADFGQRLLGFGEAHCHPSLALTDRTAPSHRVGFVAGEQRAMSVEIRAPTMTADAIRNLRNGANAVEEFDEIR